MRIGILSDTHGNARRTAEAAERLAGYEVVAVFHCGDVGSPEVLDVLSETFAPAGVPVYVVAGNVDGGDIAGPAARTPAGVIRLGRAARVAAGGRTVGIAHGDDARALHDLIHGADCDVVLTGHTHAAEDRRVGRTRVINPGAVHRSARPTAAVLDLATGELALIALDGNLAGA